MPLRQQEHVALDKYLPVYECTGRWSDRIGIYPRYFVKWRVEREWAVRHWAVQLHFYPLVYMRFCNWEIFIIASRRVLGCGRDGPSSIASTERYISLWRKLRGGEKRSTLDASQITFSSFRVHANSIQRAALVHVYVLAIARTYMSPSDLYFVILY